ncbi:S49 family peptidase [Parvularcula sp. IMCC14364]|uniref:S49 family peptidase n=1 Tax=Parvularcula sp. IMCC14364 TaxID=3067902 RepID=UPI00274134F2|nr:S49 family peptidase [Parvularcula sp. IMCC14364]
MTKITDIPRKIWDALPFTGAPKPVVTHLELSGVIATSSRTGKSLNLRRVEKALDEAFAPGNLKAVALSVNSPGGSPVQSRLILDRIRLLAKEKEIPVLTFVEDVGASGGYILAIAGDEVYADPSSIVGSIGVIGGGFGFPEAMSKLGIERRIYTAGENKSQLDPFKPEDPADVERHQVLMDALHEIFIDLVKARRGDKLTTEKNIFTGEYWHADAARSYGLIDEIGDVRSVLQEKYGKDIKIKRIETDERSLIQKLLAQHPQAMPSALVSADEIIDTLETRTQWSRFGL